MKLDYYLWRNKIKHSEFAKKIGVSATSLSAYINKRRQMTLVTALKIHFETKMDVPLYELLLPEEMEEVNKMYSIVKKECVYKDDKDDKVTEKPDLPPKILAELTEEEVDEKR
jgi:transcriptional regulator with XRE-family HTH domain